MLSTIHARFRPTTSKRDEKEIRKLAPRDAADRIERKPQPADGAWPLPLLVVAPSFATMLFMR